MKGRLSTDIGVTTNDTGSICNDTQCSCQDHCTATSCSNDSTSECSSNESRSSTESSSDTDDTSSCSSSDDSDCTEITETTSGLSVIHKKNKSRKYREDKMSPKLMGNKTMVIHDRNDQKAIRKLFGDGVSVDEENSMISAVSSGNVYYQQSQHRHGGNAGHRRFRTLVIHNNANSVQNESTYHE